MKKIMIGSLIALLLLSVSACKDPVQTTQDSTGTSTVESTQVTHDTTPIVTDTVTQQLPLYAVSVPVLTESDTAEDGTVLFNQIYQNISLIVPDPEVADKIIVDFLNRTDMRDSAASIRSEAEVAYADDPQHWSAYLSQFTYDPMRIDAGILSMFGSNVSYNGAVHAGAVYHSVSYDLVTGEVLKLADILTESAANDALCKEAVKVLDDLAEEKALYEGYDGIVKDLFALDLPMNESWYFSNYGLCFYFEPYEIAPYSSGPIIAEIPYDRLPGILTDAYFPAEQQTSAGSINAELFNETALERFTQFSEVIIDQGGCKILIHTDSLVYNIRLETGSWSSDGDLFIPEHTVFAAYTLSVGDAIMVESDIPDTMPTLRLSYSANDTTVYRYITTSGRDGSVLLIES